MLERPVIADDFLSDTPPERIMGVECEYFLQPHRLSPGSPALQKYIRAGALNTLGIAHCEGWLDNGPRLHIDVGHIEYATPECLGPKQTAAADFAGIKKLGAIVVASGEPSGGLYRTSGTTIMRPEGEIQSVTKGTHENYLTSREVTESEYFKAVLPSHLATRTYAMSGGIVKRFVRSQKVSGIGGHPIAVTKTRRTDEGRKPMIMIPNYNDDKDVIGVDDLARVEVRFADPVMSPLGRFLSLAATSAVLRLIEHPELFDANALDYIELADPVLAAKAYSEDLRGTGTMLTLKGKRVTAGDIQEQLATQFQKLSEVIELPADELEAIPIWHDYNSAHQQSRFDRGEYAGLDTQYDVAALHKILSKKVGCENIELANQKAVTAAIKWYDIIPEGAAQKYWSHFSHSCIPASMVDQLINDAPENTRARIRMDGLRSGPETDFKVYYWTSVEKNGRTYDLFDAYQTKL